MSRLTDKAAKVVPRAPTSPARPLETAPVTPAVAPTSRFPVAAHAMAVAEQQRVEAELDRVTQERDELLRGKPAVRLDPLVIRRSRWANRLEAEFATAEFEQLKAEIAAASGNVQPIKVRPLPGVENGFPGTKAVVASGVENGFPPRFEVIFGHRRHQACLELGLPVLCVVEELTDVELFQQMDRENRSRKDLSPYEQGRSYRHALDEGLYPSARRLAESVGVSHSIVNMSLQLAGLPREIIEAFPSPLAVQHRWGRLLAEAHLKDPAGVLERAAEAAAQRGRLTAQQVYDLLLGVAKPGPVKETQVAVGGKRLATLKSKPGGRAVIEFEAGALSPAKHAALAKLIREFLGQQ